ncbi:MAG: TetR/AcrR family transcriptional regulator [candidate division Zixibacteria bacterium]
MPNLDENLIAELVSRKVITDTFRRLHPEKKAQIYQTAVSLFGHYGYDGLSVDRICRDCAISKGSFFQYFPSKSHLLEFVLLLFDGYVYDWVSEIRIAEKAVLARKRLGYLYHAIALNSRLFPAEQTFYLFATRGLQHAGVTIEGIDLERHFREYIGDIVRRGEETGEIRGDFDIATTAYLVSVLMEGIVARSFSDKRRSTVHPADHLISFLFDGIKA